ncbi:ATP-dependent nuclease [Desulfallas thermosapovorans]|uniref:Putative AbiEii toxin of type IV toxin-antitoxin system n=1 Tax=Desulfallas thermosapovorans DSM 6562 TaxID=1121431 RepID=A0A5S4ZS69_9FIRM|nr:AAA family ATPase [Desulfallas thermosapovorans]TYO95502.1 putative AbiEii toxin of type IV toxin-antitoxin system [Desulfallas thermosapovorans DSM 6562]
MELSREMRKLENSWERGDFPKHLEWIEIKGIRGWAGERVKFKFPIVALVGENGVGKSTIIQAAASIYKDPVKTLFASHFFPDTAWEELTGIEIKSSVREGNSSKIVSIRKPTTRWRGNENRRERKVEFLDLKRIQPIYAKPGYLRLAKRNVQESESELFTDEQKGRFSTIIGKTYETAKLSTTNLDSTRQVPVVSVSGYNYSGFHQGAGESTIANLISLDIAPYSLVLIDEIETSLHPRAQRRLIRDLANISRNKKIQLIITTHSPYILEELPFASRVYIFNDTNGKKVVDGISVDFALSKIDEGNYPELDIYVEDDISKILLEEIIAKFNVDLLPRISIVPYGSASVGKSLGTMVSQGRFKKRTIVILDGDQDPAPGCLLLPGDDAPERVIFNSLKEIGWPDIAAIINRSHSQLVNNAEHAITLSSHHDWIKHVADKVIVGGNELWRAMSRVWVNRIMQEHEVEQIIGEIEEKLGQG